VAGRLTADEGRLRGEPELRPRGRQNVVLELGLFLGVLGCGRVAVLAGPDVERPSDLAGLVYVPLDPGAGWKALLLRELRAAGVDADLSKVP